MNDMGSNQKPDSLGAASSSRLDANGEQDPIWAQIQSETRTNARAEPILASFLHSTILNHDTMEAALSFHLANKLDSSTASALLMREVIEQALDSDPAIGVALRADLQAFSERDSACQQLSTPFLFYNGFQALQAYRIAHWLWQQNRTSLALYLQNRISMEFAVDIHPAARIGQGILLDHATGIVIGETAVVGDNVSILQGVTLGGTGKVSGDRHPKVGDFVLLSAGAKVLGNIRIGDCAKVGAGSVVLKDVPNNCTVAGVPAEIVGECCNQPALEMDHDLTTNS